MLEDKDKYFEVYNIDEFLQGVLAKSSWNHNQILLDKVKDKKRVIVELALKDINKPIGVSEFKILSEIPKFLENTVSSIEDIERRLGGKCL